MRPRTLIVDDSLTIRMDLRSILVDAGFLVVVCGTKASASAALRSAYFQLAILDVQLPDGSGIDLLKEIRSIPELCRLPTILLTTAAEARSRIRGLSCGADRYVSKPYDPVYIARVAQQLCQTTLVSTPDATRPLLSGHKILLLDDDQLLAAAMAVRLRSDGGELVTVRSADEALALLDMEPFAGVVISLAMAGLDAPETLRRLRRLPYGQDAKVLALTASEDATAGAAALRAGADEVAPKTPVVDLLRLRLGRLLGKRPYGFGGRLSGPSSAL